MRLPLRDSVLHHDHRSTPEEACSSHVLVLLLGRSPCSRHPGSSTLAEKLLLWGPFVCALTAQGWI